MKTLFFNMQLLMFLFATLTIQNINSQTPQNKYIYFSSEANSAGRDICRIDTNGATRIKLTSNNGNGHYPHHINPKISPDGTKIVYQSDTDRHDKYAIWIMNIDGSDKKRITLKEGMYPNWSPDGKKIIFSGRRNGIWEIITIPSSGGGETNLTQNFKEKNPPGWGAVSTYHPNGKTIVFSYVREKVLYIMNLETKEITQNSPSNHRYTQPIFSIDGTQLAAIRKIDKSYHLIIKSTKNDSIKIVSKNVISYSAPSWSHSGKEILFTGMVNGNQQLFKINLETKKETQLTNNNTFNAMPTW